MKHGGKIIAVAAALAFTALADDPFKAPPELRPAPFDPNVFRPDPTYGERSYNIDEQLKIYGAKHSNPTQRPLLEWGRELFREGPFQPSPAMVGGKNPLLPHFYAYGDWRTAAAWNDNGKNEQGTLATRLNLDLDLQITSTERIHAFVRPFDQNGKFTRWDFSGDNHDGVFKFDGNLEALFFEGDAARMASGFSGKENTMDLPFAAGLMPLLFQNGIWVQDAFTGFAFTIPARNSRFFDISNADFTFFAGFDRVTSAAVKNDAGNFADHSANVFGIATFIEANQGYWELDYGYTQGRHTLNDTSYHNVAAAFTRRYFDFVSNTVRVIWNFGQDRDPGHKQTADGVVLLIENSFMTRKPYTLLPYVNLFAGFDRPQSLARDAGAGGVLVNTGINFETDGLTGFPKLDDTARNTYGGAVGIEYLFDLHQQIVLEGAAVGTLSNDAIAKGDEYGVGIRYQVPLSNAWILRVDTIYAWRHNDEDLAGIKMELRMKF